MSSEEAGKPGHDPVVAGSAVSAEKGRRSAQSSPDFLLPRSTPPGSAEINKKLTRKKFAPHLLGAGEGPYFQSDKVKRTPVGPSSARRGSKPLDKLPIDILRLPGEHESVRNDTGGRYVSNHKEFILYLLATASSGQEFAESARKIFLSGRRQQRLIASLELVDPLLDWLRRQTGYYSENPDLIDRCLGQLSERDRAYRLLLDQLCNYQIDLRELLLKDADLDEFAFPPTSCGKEKNAEAELERVRVLNQFALVLDGAFSLLMGLKNEALRGIKSLNLLDPGRFLDRFMHVVDSNKKNNLAKFCFMKRWTESQIISTEADEWSLCQVESDLHTACGINGEELEFYDLLRLIGLLNASRVTHANHEVRERFHKEALRRFKSLKGKSINEWVVTLQIRDAAYCYPFYIIRERVNGFFKQEGEAGCITDKSWSQLEHLILTDIWKDGLIKAMTFWDLIDLYSHAAKLIVNLSLEKIVVLEVNWLLQEIKSKRRAILPSYDGEDSIEDVKAKLRLCNQCVKQCGNHGPLFSEDAINNLTKKPNRRSTILPRTEENPPFSLENLKDMVSKAIVNQGETPGSKTQSNESAKKYIIAPLVRFLREHTHAVKGQISDPTVQTYLFSDFGLLSELLPVFLNTNDLELARTLVTGCLQHNPMNEGLLLRYVSRHFAYALRLDSNRLEKLVEGQVLVAIAHYHAEDMNSHIRILSELFKHDVRAVLAYIDGMTQPAYNELIDPGQEGLGLLKRIEFSCEVDPENKAVRPYLLLTTDNSYTRGNEFCRIFIVEKKLSLFIQKSYVLHAADDSSTLHPESTGGKRFLEKLEGLKEEVPLVARSCRVKPEFLTTSINEPSGLLSRIRQSSQEYKTKIASHPIDLRQVRWEAKRKILSAMSCFLTCQVYHDSRKPEYSLQTACVQVKMIEQLLHEHAETTPGEVEFGHKKFSEKDIRLAFSGKNSVCLSIFTDFCNFCQSKDKSASGKEVSFPNSGPGATSNT